mgnify:CR=1 FL=1
MNKLVVPVPCTKNIKERTLKDWFMRIDEEVNEFKAELLKYYNLGEELVPTGMSPEDRNNIADEGSDVCTTITTIEERIRIDVEERMKSQLRVNRRNKERGRL